MICKGGDDEASVFPDPETLSTSSSELETDVQIVDLSETFSINSIDDLMAAIEVCKKQILETPEKSDRRKNMVSKLINLRIRLQDLRDKQERPVSAFEARGHVFVCYHEPGRSKITGVDDVRRFIVRFAKGQSGSTSSRLSTAPSAASPSTQAA